MRIVFVSPYVPSLIRIRTFSFVKYLARHHEVSVLALQQDEREGEHIDILRRHCEHIETVRLPKRQSFLNCLRALPTNIPLQGAYCYSNALLARLSELLAQSKYDLVHVEHLRAAYAVRALSSVPCVFDSVDCITSLFERLVENSSSRLTRVLGRIELARTRQYEAAIISQYDRVFVSSPDDKAALARLDARGMGERVYVVPNGVHLGYPKGAPDERQDGEIVFSGKMSYHANVDAVKYFCREILPLVRAKRPDVRFTIVGSNPTREVRALAGDAGVHVTGSVPDVRPYLRRAALAVVPIRYAVGIQNKVLEAMAMETPVIATPTAARALSAQPERDFIVADEAKEFAAQTIRLLDNAGLRESLGALGRQYVQENHEWTAIVERLSTAYEEAVDAHRERQLRKDAGSEMAQAA